MSDAIAALLPRGSGHHFVVYGDCCSGVPGHVHEGRFAAVNAAIRRLLPQPQFIVFAGDHIYGLTDEAAELRRQWRHFFDSEMAWLDRGRIPLYSTTSNHNTCNPVSEAVWREVFADLPDNGPRGQEGLSYWVRRGDLLLVAVNTSFSGLGGYGHVECEWLEQVLCEHENATHKLVTGHHPVWPVNGYAESPLWRIVPEQGRAMWSVLARHRVTAYLCSHIIAFDAQVQQGVLQVTTGGAGTVYGPGGFMDGPDEYHHFVQVALDSGGLRGQTIDIDGRVRERVHWRPGGAMALTRVA